MIGYVKPTRAERQLLIKNLTEWTTHIEKSRECNIVSGDDEVEDVQKNDEDDDDQTD